MEGRTDITKWVIHFVRDRKPEDLPSTSEDEYEYYNENLELDEEATGFQVLQCIIRLGGLIPGWSFRGGKTTIFGSEPVVCATEMPIFSFAQYALGRGDSQRVSAYGIAMLKEEFFQAGGRPAIYGLSTDNSLSYKTQHPTIRVLNDTVLPEKEQFRLVSHNLGPQKQIDWSHEREWRWKKNQENHTLFREGRDGLGPYPGLPLFADQQDGGHFTQIGIIVSTKDEADIIRKNLTGFFISGGNNYDTRFSKDVISNSFVIVLENVVAAVNAGTLKHQTIEGIGNQNLISPIHIVSNNKIHDKSINAAWKKMEEAARIAAEEYIKNNPNDSPPCGFAHVCTTDVTNGLVQRLIELELAIGPFDGVVKIPVFDKDLPRRQAVDYEIAIAREMCKVLNEKTEKIFEVRWEFD